ncbi:MULTISPECIES: riboflavin synthase [Bacillus]|uniref:Riboflavin synthase n=1 Tax=Bacillus glycinifermentans TaxID=1664069 RepID=A0AAJ3YZ97_9BACI|nr:MULTISPECIES: riboflavin synthase [Bacillus]KKB74706.1 riboflavin synthase subunit alpha [Bacillus sp. TH008]MDU0070939.1 riboflavin synthase [Bacillus sp. IG6]MED8018805.1 riboflavin synthase [Bacillus glycinifermentans]QAT65872.1 riboflavin synthase [Bacillus glycinifermentans]WKB75575.1 riboflavin synthase [Bacillus glycinifermentans]
MFTGIIEEIGTIKDMRKTGNAMSLVIASRKVTEDVKLGDSIAVNGVCLTVTGYKKDQFTADVMLETLKATSLGALKIGSSVNLERAMAANGRFGGHMVSGHVDGTASIVRIEKAENSIYYDLKLDPALAKMLVLKGSIAVDGVSLTIFGLTDDEVTVSLIPHTLDETIFSEKKVGSIVNVECDMIGKYIYRFLHRTNEEKQTKIITETFLKENGF